MSPKIVIWPFIDSSQSFGAGFRDDGPSSATGFPN